MRLGLKSITPTETVGQYASLNYDRWAVMTSRTAGPKATWLAVRRPSDRALSAARMAISPPMRARPESGSATISATWSSRCLADRAT